MADKRKQKILETALSRFQLMQEANEEINRVALEDMRFIKGEQWPDDILNARKQDNRPSLVINKLHTAVRQIVNDQKQNRPAIEVNPVDDYADVDTAEVLQGLIRNIENVSDAEYAYDTAFEGACRCGRGFFRLYTDYVSDDSFEQELRIGVIDNPFKAGIDPYSIMLDGSDAKWGFVWDTMTKEEFEAEYGKKALEMHSDWETIGEDHKGWAGPDELRVAEYYYKDFERVKLIQLSGGENYFEDELPEQNEDGSYSFTYEMMDPTTGEMIEVIEDETIIDERWSKRCKVKHCKLTAVDVLE
jgi:hypothetical protein